MWRSGHQPVVVGTPAQVADALEAWIEATDVDGFNMAFALAPETLARHRPSPGARSCSAAAATLQRD
jgi:alkanesulfonate monooxygenase SsuD/methylene tetrahydromethanopterin reductase-like flavin-dependent oxidoreductase (luciferase family)